MPSSETPYASHRVNIRPGVGILSMLRHLKYKPWFAMAEFGMGMKSAACWFAPRWRARTSALGEAVERTISFDIATIVREDIQELEVIDSPAAADSHFTEITLLDPYNKLQTRTGAKIKEHLASIYRIFLREGVLDLRFDGEELSYEMAPVLVQPYFKTPNEPAKRWYKEFDLDLGLGLRAHGVCGAP